MLRARTLGSQTAAGRARAARRPTAASADAERAPTAGRRNCASLRARPSAGARNRRMRATSTATARTRAPASSASSSAAAPSVSRSVPATRLAHRRPPDCSRARRPRGGAWPGRAPESRARRISCVRRRRARGVFARAARATATVTGLASTARVGRGPGLAARLHRDRAGPHGNVKAQPSTSLVARPAQTTSLLPLDAMRVPSTGNVLFANTLEVPLLTS